MRYSLFKYYPEIVEFMSAKTLEEIDYGIVDLSHIKNHELRAVFTFFEELLEMELRLNYLENNTGIFRVDIVENRYYYREFGEIIEADSINSLKEMVLAEDRIWYVFDEVLAREII